MTNRVLHRVKVPASAAALDLERVRRALFKADGDVSRAAKSLKVKSSDLRRLTWRHPTLIMDALERAHRLVDKAEEKLREALDGDHRERSLRAATFILSHSAAAREQGWGGSFGGYGDDPLPPCAPQIVVWEGTCLRVIVLLRRRCRRPGGALRRGMAVSWALDCLGPDLDRGDGRAAILAT
jgi:hypothetical protein